MVLAAATTSVVLAATTSVVLAAVEITVPAGGRCPFRGPPAVLGQSLSPDTIPQHTDSTDLPGGADVHTPGDAVAGPVLALGRAHPATVGNPASYPCIDPMVALTSHTASRCRREPRRAGRRGPSG